MNYKDVVNLIKQIAEDHYMIKDWGYGTITDIPVMNESVESPDYPYLFILPNGVQYNNSAVTYNFNLILMELGDDEYLNVQSGAIQILNDVIAQLVYHYKEYVNPAWSIQVFKERFQDSVAGATATIQITVPNKINNCELPIE